MVNVDYWCSNLLCKVVAYSIYDFADLVLDSKEVRRFIEFSRLVRLVMDRFWDSYTSTHSGVDRWIATLSKIVNIARDPSECSLSTSKSITCYEVFALGDLDRVLKLNKMFSGSVKRYRLYVVGTSMYIVNYVFARIESLQLEHTITCCEPDGRYREDTYIDRRLWWILKRYRVVLVYRYSDDRREVRVYAENMKGEAEYIGSIDVDLVLKTIEKSLGRPISHLTLVDLVARMLARRSMRMVSRWIAEKENRTENLVLRTQ